MARQPMGDVVVVLPGILGSVLQKDGEDVWGLSPGAVFRGLLSLGKSIKRLQITDEDPSVDDLGDGITASRLMPDVHMIPGFWKIDGYGKITKTIRDTFDVTPGENYFEFPYDWRRDNRVAARKLRRASHDWLRDWRAKSGNDDARLILLGHSMGGIVSRAFLELEEGRSDTRMLITFGTPYRGSLNALGFLANGFAKKLGPLPLIDLTDLLRSMASVYQLLPVYRCYDGGDGTLTRPGETTGIPNVDPERAAAALAFHHEIRDAAVAHERAYSIHPVVGIDQPTLQSARRAGEKVKTLRHIGGDDMGGDGTVPRVSAMPLEWDDPLTGTFSSEVHSSIQNSDPILTQVKGLLTGGDIDLGAFRDPFRDAGAASPALGLDVDDVFGADEPVAIRARTAIASLELVATITDVDTGAEEARVALSSGTSDWRHGELPPLPGGAYRITLGSATVPQTISDVFTVFGEIE